MFLPRTLVAPALMLTTLAAGFAATADPPAGDPAAHRKALKKFALAGNGNPAAGRAVFGRSCAGCHSLDGSPGVGPSLADVGGRLTRPEIVRQILDPAGATVRVTFHDGRVEIFRLVSETDRELTVRPLAGGEPRTLRKDDLASVHRGKSAMPTRLADRMTPQEFADLVEFLVRQTGGSPAGSGGGSG